MNLEKIAVIRTDFPSKFGIPRQSGRVEGLEGRIIFEKPYRDPNSLRGLEGYSHIWLLWGFSANSQTNGKWSPTVRPPRLGGNMRMGVFATRSPNRPNPVGLSAVRLVSVEHTQEYGDVLVVDGVDLMDNTPIYDIKPYLPASDCIQDAKGGFSSDVLDYHLEVFDPQNLLDMIEPKKRAALIGVLSDDPRPSYQNDPERIYGFEYAGFEIRFSVEGKKLTICGIVCH